MARTGSVQKEQLGAEVNKHQKATTRTQLECHNAE
jgi:hypothetical protein